MESITTDRKSHRKRYKENDSLLNQTRKQLNRLGLRARKGLAQHFLVDEEVLRLIVNTAGLIQTDFVIEVGPGLGTLTEYLAEKAGRVVAIELDDKLAASLETRLASFRNVSVINDDVLKVKPEVLLKDFGIEQLSSGYKVVANLPYYITSPVLRHFLEAEVKPVSMVVMVQKEVAEEIAAGPGKMSLLSVGVQLYGEPEIVDYVPAGCFYPVPGVDSAILKVTPYARPGIEEKDTDSFFTLVRAGFSAARKQLVNSLAQGLGVSKEETLSLLNGVQIEPQRRAETLSLEEWVRLWRTYCEVAE